MSTCPDTLQPWLEFYADLLLYGSPDEIILSLNRLLNTDGNDYLEKMEVKGIANKVFKRITDVFSLKYQEIQKLTNGKSEHQVFDFQELDGHSTSGSYDYRWCWRGIVAICFHSIL